MRISLFNRSSHLIFGRAMDRVPVTFILNVLLVMWVSSLRITCPYHDSRFYVRTDLIGVTFAIPLMISFLILYFLDCTLALSFLWYVNAAIIASGVPNTHSHTQSQVLQVLCTACVSASRVPSYRLLQIDPPS